MKDDSPGGQTDNQSEYREMWRWRKNTLWYVLEALAEELMIQVLQQQEQFYLDLRVLVLMLLFYIVYKTRNIRLAVPSRQYVCKTGTKNLPHGVSIFCQTKEIYVKM